MMIVVYGSASIDLLLSSMSKFYFIFFNVKFFIKYNFVITEKIETNILLTGFHSQNCMENEQRNVGNLKRKVHL